MKTYSENRKASFDFEFLEKFNAGLVLLGQEVKSIKLGRASLAGSYIIPRGMSRLSGASEMEFFLVGCHIPPYQPKNAGADYSPERFKKLLLTKKEIDYLAGRSQTKGLTLIPLKLYNLKGMIKLEFALSKPLKKFDKREIIKKRDTEREIREVLG